MDWSGIFCVHVPDGVDAQDAIDATAVGWITWDGEAVGIEPNTDPPNVPVDSDWAKRARNVLLSINPDLEKVDQSGTLDDGRGPVWITVYANEVQLKPKKRWQGEPEIDGFAVWWKYCVVLAEQAQCIAHNSEEAGLIDRSLDVETARSYCNWL